MGITATLVEILGEPYDLSLPKLGDTLVSGDTFGSIEGSKMSTDLISPVSGQVIQINDLLDTVSGMQLSILWDTPDAPYNAGWMIVVSLIKPAELKDLLSPQNYISLLSH